MDSNNRKSYTGPPIQNKTGGISFAGVGTGTGYVCTSVTEVIDIPQLGPTTVYTSNIQNNYGTSGNCCPSLFQYGGYAVTGSTLYTYGIVYRSQSGYTHPNFMYRYEYNGGTYVTESGVHDTSKRIHLGNGWWWAWNTFTTQPSTNLINSSGLWYYQYSSFSDKISVAKIFVTQGDYTGLHPKYWPNMNVTRSNTQALVDLTGNNTITASSLTYASDGTFSFNGSSNYIDCGNATALQQSAAITMSAWVYPTSWSGLGNIMAKNGNSGYRFRLDSGAGALWWYVSGNSIQGGNCPLNTWSHCVVTGDSSGLKAYVNGVLVASNATAFTPSAPASGNLNIGTLGGAEYFQGKIASGFIYNRALTAAEVQQNFNAQRGRYGL